MWNFDYDTWINYQNGNLNRKLTKEEYSEIRACDFAMHLLIPTDKLLKKCGGYDNLKSILDDKIKIGLLANQFLVPQQVMYIKIKDIIEEHEYIRKEDIKKRILKKEGNVTYLK